MSYGCVSPAKNYPRYRGRGGASPVTSSNTREVGGWVGGWVGHLEFLVTQTVVCAERHCLRMEPGSHLLSNARPTCYAVYLQNTSSYLLLATHWVPHDRRCDGVQNTFVTIRCTSKNSNRILRSYPVRTQGWGVGRRGGGPGRGSYLRRGGWVGSHWRHPSSFFAGDTCCKCWQR